MIKVVLLSALLCSLTYAWPQKFYSDIANSVDTDYAVADNDCPSTAVESYDHRYKLWLWDFEASNPQEPNNGYYLVHFSKGKRCTTTYLTAKDDCSGVYLAKYDSSNNKQHWQVNSNYEKIKSKNFNLISPQCNKEIDVSHGSLSFLEATGNDWVNLTYYDRQHLHLDNYVFSDFTFQEFDEIHSSNVYSNNDVSYSKHVIQECSPTSISEAWFSSDLDWTMYFQTVSGQSIAAYAKPEFETTHYQTWQPANAKQQSRDMIWDGSQDTSFPQDQNMKQCVFYEQYIPAGQSLKVEVKYKKVKTSAIFSGRITISYTDEDGTHETSKQSTGTYDSYSYYEVVVQTTIV